MNTVWESTVQFGRSGSIPWSRAIDPGSRSRSGAATAVCMMTLAGLLISCSDTITGPPATGKAVTPALASTPVPATPTPAAAAHSDTWDVTDRVVGDDGPDFCIHTAKVGSVYHGIYTIRRNGSAVSFIPADFIDWESYEATLQGTSFTATNPSFYSSAQSYCTGFSQSSSLSGSFSPDGNSLTATETWSFRPDSGELKTLTFHWEAVRR